MAGLIAGIILLLLALAVGGWLLYKALSNGSAKQVTLPPVIGRPIDEASKILTDAGFKVTEDPVANAAFAAGIVYAQSPRAGHRSTRAPTSSSPTTRPRSRWTCPTWSARRATKPSRSSRSSG